MLVVVCVDILFVFILFYLGSLGVDCFVVVVLVVVGLGYVG